MTEREAMIDVLIKLNLFPDPIEAEKRVDRYLQEHPKGPKKCPKCGSKNYTWWEYYSAAKCFDCNHVWDTK